MSMRRPRWLLLPAVAVILFLVVVAAIAAVAQGRPLPVPTREQLFTGVVYTRRVSLRPRPMIIHVITIDMRTTGLRFLVTPPDDKGSETPLKARTTSGFMAEYGLQIAINGDGFSPWWSRSLADYYPHTGDPVHPRGLTASRGKIYWETDANLPTLYMSSRNYPSFAAPAKPYNAISGDPMLVAAGSALPGLDDGTPEPRTAVGYSRNGRYLYLVVVDGRQPLYSEGMTLKDLGELMVSVGAQYAMNLDGGGSSTMVIQGSGGRPRMLNSPIDSYVPGRERPVADHLGVSIKGGP